MNIQIKATHVSLSAEIEDYLRKKLGKTDKLLANDRGAAMARVELAKTTEHHRAGDVFRAEITLDLKGKTLFAFAEAGDLLSAIDLMQAEIIREIVSHKGKKMSMVRRGALRLKEMLRFGKGSEE